MPGCREFAPGGRRLTLGGRALLGSRFRLFTDFGKQEQKGKGVERDAL